MWSLRNTACSGTCQVCVIPSVPHMFHYTRYYADFTCPTTRGITQNSHVPLHAVLHAPWHVTQQAGLRRLHVSHSYYSGYFDNNNGQKLFLEDILMEIKIDNIDGEMWDMWSLRNTACSSEWTCEMLWCLFHIWVTVRYKIQLREVAWISSVIDLYEHGRCFDVFSSFDWLWGTKSSWETC